MTHCVICVCVWLCVIAYVCVCVYVFVYKTQVWISRLGLRDRAQHTATPGGPGWGEGG